MQDPVKCFDGTINHTYERSAIEKYFENEQQNDKVAVSPLTKRDLQIEYINGKCQLVLRADEGMHQKIKQLEKETHIREMRMKQEAEGDEERRIFLRRMGYDMGENNEYKTENNAIASAQDLLHRLNKSLHVYDWTACIWKDTYYVSDCVNCCCCRAEMC